MLNKVQIIGRLGKDPETKYLPNGTAVTNVSIATTERWKGKDGSKQEKTEWHKVVFWGRIAEIAGEYLAKGSLAYVEGKLETRKWQDQGGNDRYTTEIKAHELKLLGADSGNHQEPQQPKSRQQAPQQQAQEFSDEDIPF